MQPPHPSKPESHQALCRICHSGPSPESKLVSPCSCRGTCSAVHAACLEEWITRRIRSGQTLHQASTCEICLQTYAHEVHVPSSWNFLLGKGSWGRWAHVCYIGFVGRRLLFETRVVVKILKSLVRAEEKVKGRVGNVLGRMAFSSLMALHYGLFVVLDFRHLLAQFRAWRAVSCRVVVRDRIVEEEGEENV